MAIRSLEALEKACENKNIYDVILEDDCLERGVTREESEKKMADLYAAIQHSAQNYTPTLRSASGMAGGDGAKMRSYVKAGKTICGDELGQVIAQALEMELCPADRVILTQFPESSRAGRDRAEKTE